jgi:GNAT superfamily N-acetyltransferase
MEQPVIYTFRKELAAHFLAINQQWIEAHFCMEPFDWEQLKNPSENIVEKGGQVWFAAWQGKIVGTVAVKPIEDGTYELIKMGVLPEAQGKKVGQLLAESAITWAKSQGAQKIVLYSNTKLAPAIGLYLKIGFRETPIEAGKYARCDIKMEMEF